MFGNCNGIMSNKKNDKLMGIDKTMREQMHVGPANTGVMGSVVFVVLN